MVLLDIIRDKGYMMHWEIREIETGITAFTEFDLGNAAEHIMFLDEMCPGTFEMVEIDEVEGA